MKKKIIIIVSSLVVVITIVLLSVLLTRKKKLSTPSIVLIDDTIYFEEVKNATGYDIYIDSQKTDSISTTSYQITVEADGEYEVYIKAISSNKKYKSSNKSNSILFKKLTLDVPTIRLEDRIVRWNKVEDAIKYEILVDGLHKDYTEELYYELDLNTLEHNISVIAIGNDKNIKSSESSISIQYKQLQAPILSKEGNYITWPEIANSSEYVVYVDGNKMVITEDRIEIPNMLGLHEFKVSYIGKNGYASSNFSSIFYVENYEQLSSVTNIRVDGNYIKWDAVTNAIGYKVEINDGENVDLKTTTYSYYDYTDLEYGSYDIRIVSLANESMYYKDSTFSYTFALKYLPKLTSPEAYIEDDILKWNVIEGAIGYSIYNKDLLLVEGIATLQYDLTLIKEAAYYELSVVANGDYINNSNSDKSNVCDYLVSNRLDTPSFTILDKTINVNPVLNATGYYIYIDDVRVGKTETSTYSLDDLAVGEYIVTVSAYNDDKNLFADSLKSEEIRCVVKGIYNEVSSGIISFDTNSYLLDINSKGLTIEAPNTPLILDGEYDYNGVSYSIGYPINGANKIKISTKSLTTIKVIYKGNGNGGIYLKDTKEDNIYEILKITSVGIDITPSANNIPEGDYELYSTEDIYVLAVIIDAREDEYNYEYTSYTKESYSLMISSFDMNGYDEVCVSALSTKRNGILLSIEQVKNIVKVEEFVREFYEYTSIVVKSSVKDQYIERVTIYLEELGKNSDEINTVCNAIGECITISDINEILYINNIEL